MVSKKYSIDFGKKERVLNYTSNTYQLTRPNKVGAVMALIRECQPKSFEEWERWYFDNASTETKAPTRITQQSLEELGERLYEKLTVLVIPEWQKAFSELTKQDCIEYVYNLVINRTYDGYIREISVVYDELAKRFPQVRFEESDAQMDHAGDIDYLGWINGKAFGLQIKPVSNKAGYDIFKPSERMQASFSEFEVTYSGKVFIVYSEKGKVINTEVIAEIEDNVTLLSV